jgi:Xaa-Pro aminopeptidase
MLALSVPFAHPEEIPVSEFVERRHRLMEKLSDGIVLLRARASGAAGAQPGFVQEPSFAYFTGLLSQPGGVLALDGPREETWFFVPPAPTAFWFTLEDLSLPPGDASARRHGFDRVVPWSELGPFVDRRLSQGVTRLYVDEARWAENTGTPEPLWPVEGEKTLWRRAVAQAFPRAEVVSAAGAIRELRWVKSPREVEALRRTAQATSAALLAGLRAIAPGKTQRVAESAVVTACSDAGGEGPSFWPWLMSGRTAKAEALARSVYDYHHHNREMKEGELVRVDVGCDLGGYRGDVGRTAPVSGRFSAEQRETWELMLRAYRAGLEVMRAGAAVDSVFEAARRAIAAAESSLTTDLARAAARSLLGENGLALFNLHGVGVDSGESRLDRLAAGSVVAWEPMFEVGEEAYYLEDMIRISETGYEILSTGLPYTAAEIEAAMRPRD